MGLVSTVAAAAVASLLAVGVAGPAVALPGLGLRNWLVVLFSVNVGLSGVSFGALRQLNPLDLAVLILAAVAFAGFWPGPRKPHRGWMAATIALPLVGVGVLLVTGLWGRSGLMSAAIVMSFLLLGSRMWLGVTGIAANALLLVGDFGTTGSRSLVMALLLGVAYALLVVWFVGLALALRSRSKR